MGVLRMIKLFGWEARVKGAASAKREEELRWLFTNKMFRMLINIIGCVTSLSTLLHDIYGYAQPRHSALSNGSNIRYLCACESFFLEKLFVCIR